MRVGRVCKVVIGVAAIFFYVACHALVQAQGVGLKRYRPTQQRDIVDYKNPVTYFIGGIEVAGTSTLNEETLLSVIELKAGDKVEIPGDAISSAIKRLWKQALLHDVQVAVSKIEGDKVFLALHVIERPRLIGYDIKGVKKTYREELKEKLTVVKGSIITDVMLNNIKNTARDYLEEKGYLQAAISVEEEADAITSNGSRLHIVILRNRRLRMGEIHVHGNLSPFSEAKLVSKLNKLRRGGLYMRLHRDLFTKFIYFPFTTRAWRTPFSYLKGGHTHLLDYLREQANVNIFRSSKFQKDAYEESKESLVSYLQKKGYREARIVADKVNIANSISIDVDLHVGPRYYVGDIDWTGNYLYSSEQLQKVLGVERGDIYSLEEINRRIQYNPRGVDITSLYMDNGHLFFNIQPIERRIKDNVVALEIRMYEGPKAKIDYVFLSGNERTYDHVLYREFRTLPGNQFRRSEIIRTQQALGQLKYIDVEQTSFVPLPNPEENDTDVEWKIAEKSGDQIELSAGWGSGIGLVGTLGFVMNNFSLKDITKPAKWRPLPIGSGQILTVRYRTNGLAYTSLSTSFTEPWLGGYSPSSLYLGYDISRQNDLARDGETITGHFSLQIFSLGTGRALQWPDSYFKANANLSYRRYTVNNLSSRSLGFDNGTSNNLALNLTLSRNSLDNYIYPRGGSLLSLNVGLTPPVHLWRGTTFSSENERYKWIAYHKWVADYKYYIEFLDKLVLENRLHFGYIGQYNNKYPATPFERFSLGGDGITGQNFILATDIIGLRGYPNNSIYPESRSANTLEGTNSFSKFVFELRYALTESQAATFYLLTFFEGGNTWNKGRRIDLFDNYQSAGFGIRALLPVGFLGVDWGHRFHTIPGRFGSGSEVHFVLGQSVR